MVMSSKLVQEILVFGYLPHTFNLHCFVRNFNSVNTPKSSLSKVLTLCVLLYTSHQLLMGIHNICMHVCCGYSLEAPQQGTSNEHPHLHMVLWRNNKDIHLGPVVQN